MNEITVKVQTDGESQTAGGETWSWKDETNRLDLLASVILATSLAASAAGFAITAAGIRHETKVFLWLTSGLLLIPTMLSLLSLDISPSGGRMLQSVAESKRSRVRPALWLVTLMIEIGAVLALLAQTKNL